jgi:glutamyl-tRNA synthetase
MAKKKITDDLIMAYALKNAIDHKGKAQAGAVISSLFNEGLEKSEIKGIMPRINAAVKEVNDTGLTLQKNKLAAFEKIISHRKVKKEGELPELPGAKKGKVIMRVAPSPSGPLHMMHAINISLNHLFVKKYGGKLYIRIEDTNPENIYKPAYDMIKKESDWLTDKRGKIMIQSERIDIYYKYAEKLINKGAAYVCTCDSEEFKKIIEKKQACGCRIASSKINLERWNKMLDKKGFKPGEAVLRFKSSVTDPNPALRDFPLARINTEKHPLQGTKYRVWPLMNLAVTVDDLESGMTHIIRGKDHKDNAKRQEMMYKALGKSKQYPWVGFTGMTNFKDMKFSTRQMRQDIEKKKFKGWDDPRLPTVASLKKRGYKIEAFRKMAAHTGNLDEVDKVISKKDFFEVLDRFNAEARQK